MKDRARRLADQTKDRAEFLREESQFLVQQARDRGQDFVEQVKERGQTIGEQMKENTQSWTEQIQEQLDAVVEELGGLDAVDRPVGRSQNLTEPETSPLDEEDLLSGDWGLPTPPASQPAVTEPIVDRPAPSENVLADGDRPAVPDPEPASPTETTLAYALDPGSVTNLDDDDFWDQPLAPQVSSAAIDVPAAAVAEAVVDPPTEDESIQDKSTGDESIEEVKSHKDESIAPPIEEDDEPWI